MQRITAIFVAVLLIGGSLLRAQDMDKEISNLATNLATTVKNQEKKKVAVIDFTDLEGGENELGKYVAEQLTVDLVMVRHDFSVLDRGNLRKILAEHKLTATGLVERENAKQLGKFAGVDAIILGTVVPKAQRVSLTAKIISTDTAEIVGAEKGEFPSDQTVQQLLSRTVKVEEPAATNETSSSSPPAARKPFGHLQAKVESLRLAISQNLYGFATLTLIITNTSQSETYGVAFPPDRYHDIDFRNSREDWFEVTEVAGIGSAFDRNDNVFQGSLTDIPPMTSISVVAKTQVRWNGKPGDYRPYRFQTMVIFGTESKGQYFNIRKYNLILDIK